MEELREVISSIDLYGVDLQELAHEQPLGPDFRQISQEAWTGLNFKRVDIIVDVCNGPKQPSVPQAWRKCKLV